MINEVDSSLQEAPEQLHEMLEYFGAAALSGEGKLVDHIHDETGLLPETMKNGWMSFRQIRANLLQKRPE
jgi:hypothetical protein